LNSIQLITARNFILFLTFIAFSIQLFLINNINDFYCLTLLIFSNVITTFYCFNKKYFFDAPITLMIIFFSNFINLGGVLYLKSFEISVITLNLNYPLSTILNLTIFNFIIIFSHLIYIKSDFKNKLRNKFTSLFIRLNLFEFNNKNFFYFLSLIAILSKFLIYDLNTPYYLQNTGDLSIFKDFLNGLNYLVYVPIIILFNKCFQSKNFLKINNLYLLIYLILLMFIAIARNNRSMLFDFFLLTILIFLFLFFLYKIKLNKKNYFVFFIILFLILPFSNHLEKLSTNFLLERQNYFDRSPIQNVNSFIKSLFSSSNKKNLYNDKKYNVYELYSENNYSISFFNRINIIKVHDNFINVKKNISYRKLQLLKDIQLNKIISIIPNPIIKIFDNNFNKLKYTTFSTASFLYGNLDYQGSTLNIGSALMTLFIIFDLWFYVILLFCFIPIFIFFDSFYDNKKNILSPFIIIFFYTSSMGVFNFFSASEVHLWISFIIRTMPQTFLIIILFRFFFNLLTKQKSS
jgi:hypothetical protein